jgi:hypothetical protein
MADVWRIPKTRDGTIIQMKISNGKILERDYFNVILAKKALEIHYDDKSVVREYATFAETGTAHFEVNPDTGYVAKSIVSGVSNDSEVIFQTPLNDLKFDGRDGVFKCSGMIMYNFRRAISAIIHFEGTYDIKLGVFTCDYGVIIHEPFFYGAADVFKSDEEFNKKINYYHGMSVTDFISYIKKSF